MRFISAFTAFLFAGTAVAADSFILANGLTVVVDRQPAQPRVAAELWFRAGSSYENPAQAGIAHLFEHAFPRSSISNNPANARAWRDSSLDGNAQTKNDYARYYIEFTSNALDLGLALLAARMAAPPESISESDLERHKKIVMAEMRNARGRDWDPAVVQPIRERLWGAQHPYGHSTYGTEASVGAITIEMLRRWFVERYSPRSALLIVAGDTTAAAVRESAERWFGSIRGASVPGRPWARDPPRDVVQSATTSYRRGPGYGEPDAEYLDLFLRIAGESTVALYELGGEYSVRGELDVSVSSSQLAAAKAAFEREMLQSLDRLGWQGSRIELLGEGMLFRGNRDFYKERLDRAMKATTDDLQKAVSRWLSAPRSIDRTATVAVGPAQSPGLPRVERGMIGGVDTLVAVRPHSQLSEITLIAEGHRAIDTLHARVRGIGGSARVARAGVVVTVASKHLDEGINAATEWLGGTPPQEVDEDLARNLFDSEVPKRTGMIIVCDRAVPASRRPSRVGAAAALPLVTKGRVDVGDTGSREVRMVIVMPFESMSMAVAAQGLIRPMLRRLLREEKSWTYDVASQVLAIGGWHLVVLDSVLSRSNVDDAVRATETLIDSVAANPIDIDPIRTALRRDIINAVASTSTLSRYLADLLPSASSDPLAERWREIEALSGDPLRAAIGDARNRSVWIVEGRKTQ